MILAVCISPTLQNACPLFFLRLFVNKRGELRKADHVSIVVVDGSEDDGAPKLCSVLAHALTLIPRPAFVACLIEQHFIKSGGFIYRCIKDRKVLTYHFAGLVAVNL